ncbi:hypothetical protein ACQFX9_15120 [Aliinostoc sp. HNIBRCY26]|uniref:hypothetical protein n=1 Tax=Aliinostoc sp. HNIBRCY26 TaxID=3418997 RepID=UPI003D07B0E5
MSRIKILSFLSTILTLLVLPQPRTLAQYFQGSIEPTEIYQLSTPQRIVIPPLNSSEITPNSTSESVGSEDELFAPPSFDTVITRELPGIWQMRVPIEQVGLLYATYELRAGNGRINTVSYEDNSGSTVAVVLEPLPIVEISRDPDTNTALVEGGVRLKMDLSNARLAGGYTGDLTVTVKQR